MLQGGHRARPQGARRPGGQRPGRVRRDRRAREGRARDLDATGSTELLLGWASGLELRSPLYARVARELAGDPRVDQVFGEDPDWRAPLQLFAGLHYLVLSRRATWDDVGAALGEHAGFLRERVAGHGVQTNEVQRSWMLLPCFLEVAARTGAQAFDLVELGTSGGLNLLWDRFRYRYTEGTWGRRDAYLELEGSERRAVPSELLALEPVVRSRVGVDLEPVDLATDDGVALVKSFIWADQTWRLDLLDRAVEAFRADPPRIVRGDLVEELPRLLAGRDDGALMLVWQTAVFGYLTADERRTARETLEHAGAEGPLALVEASRPVDGSDDYYGLRIQIWPGGDRVEVAHGDWHGAWLDWSAA